MRQRISIFFMLVVAAVAVPLSNRGSSDVSLAGGMDESLGRARRQLELATDASARGADPKVTVDVQIPDVDLQGSVAQAHDDNHHHPHGHHDEHDEIHGMIECAAAHGRGHLCPPHLWKRLQAALTKKHEEHIQVGNIDLQGYTAHTHTDGLVGAIRDAHQDDHNGSALDQADLDMLHCVRARGLSRLCPPHFWEKLHHILEHEHEQEEIQATDVDGVQSEPQYYPWSG